MPIQESLDTLVLRVENLKAEIEKKSAQAAQDHDTLLILRKDVENIQNNLGAQLRDLLEWKRKMEEEAKARLWKVIFLVISALIAGGVGGFLGKFL
jgi:hypothetical protein